MTHLTGPTVWLAYVSSPFTTAAYLERALRMRCTVVTIGPTPPPELAEAWRRQGLTQPIRPQDIQTDYVPDMEQVYLRASAAGYPRPDLFLWVEATAGFAPRHVERLPCVTACYLIDSHLQNIAWHPTWATYFRFAFVAQKYPLPRIQQANPLTHWLPLACDPGIHARYPLEKTRGITFVGNVDHNPRRATLLSSLSAQTGVFREQAYLDDMARLFSASRIVFNSAVSNDLNMRVFEAMSTGSLLLTDRPRESGQETLFVDGDEYALYRNDEELVDVARFYLENDAIREQIAARGRQVVHNAHTYLHRVDELLAVALGGRASTSTAEELRERSVAGLATPFEVARESVIPVGSNRRSFVIPVLDYSPASEYSIVTLLKDLEQIPGDVIVIFNDEAVAAELRSHPRITNYAIMKHNVGVARAWNLGLSIAETPTVFIVNADVHLEPSVVEALEQALETLDRPACVGPQGSFFDFRLARDYLYFDKGSFDRPIEVDAVSGFLFAVRRELFEAKVLRFENAFTPCYFEEWDLGLQARKSGYKGYIVPTTGYDHHWSGSIAARREIAYYDRSETPQAILKRNRLLFQTKWRDIARRENCASILESGLKRYGRHLVEDLLLEGRLADAEQTARELLLCIPDDPEIHALTGYLLCRAERPNEAVPFFRRASQIDDSFDVEAFIASLR